MKRTFTDEERDCVFDLWKQGAGFSDIGRVIDAKPGSIFTILREHGGIKPEKRKRAATHLTIEEREEIRAGFSAKKSIREIDRQLNRAPSTISREICRCQGLVVVLLIPNAIAIIPVSLIVINLPYTTAIR